MKMGAEKINSILRRTDGVENSYKESEEGYETRKAKFRERAEEMIRESVIVGELETILDSENDHDLYSDENLKEIASRISDKTGYEDALIGAVLDKLIEKRSNTSKTVH